MLSILFAAALLANCWASNVNRQVILSDIDQHIQKEVLRPKQNRNFVTFTLHPPTEVDHLAGTTLNLTCEGLGAPAPNIRWFRNNLPIYEHDLDSNEITFSNPTSVARLTSTLLIPRTRDKDEYTCVVSSKAKAVKSTTVVHSYGGSTGHLEREKLVPLAPRILVSYKVFVDVIGSAVILPCKTKGHPRPHVVWRDNKGNIVKKDERVKVLRSGELVFSPLRWSDMGEYTCEALNAFGRDKITTFVYPAKAG